MGVGWSDLTFEPDTAALDELQAGWGWLLPEGWRPLLFSIWGDVFLETADQGVLLLNTGGGELSHAAEGKPAFRAQLATAQAEEWFLPALVERLHDVGKRPAAGRCYSFAVFPVFSEGSYQPSNVTIVPAREHFRLSGELHWRVSRLADGEAVLVQGATDLT